MHFIRQAHAAVTRSWFIRIVSVQLSVCIYLLVLEVIQNRTTTLSTQTYLICIVDLERFARLNIRSFNPIEVFTEILLHCLHQKCLLFGITKEKCLYSWEKVHGTLEKHEKRESLAQ